jgi:4-amino-4-deoxy-L-arabinose transferase-like glycosyltransferase
VSTRSLLEHVKSFSKSPLFFLCLIIVGYCALLLPTVRRQGISWDEQTDIRIARAYISTPGGWFVGSNSDPSQTRLPMYTVALVYALTGTDDLLTARLVSAFLGDLTLVGVYVFCRRETDAKRGLLAAALLATSPFFLSFARVAFTETDIYVACIFVWLLVGVSNLREKRTVGSVVIAAVLLGLAISAKFTAVYLFPAILLHSLSWPRLERGPEYLRWRDLLGASILFAILFGLAWLGWSDDSFSYGAESDAVMAAMHYLLAAVCWGMILLWIVRRSNYTASSQLLVALAFLLALSTFVMVPPVHLTNPDIVKSLLDRFNNEMGWDLGFMIEATVLHTACITFKSSPLVGLGLLAAVGTTLLQWKRRRELQFPLLVVLFYFLGLALLPIAQTFYMMPLLPILAIFGADQWLGLLSRKRLLAMLIGAAAAAVLVVDMALCYPDYNLNGYQWLGARFLVGRSTIGYRSIVQTPSDGVQQAVQWLCDNATDGERVVAYVYPWHIVEAACPDPRFIISRGRKESLRTGPDYVIIHINHEIRQRWATWFTGWENNVRDEGVFWEPYDADWLHTHFTKVATVPRSFGLEMASIWQRNDRAKESIPPVGSRATVEPTPYSPPSSTTTPQPIPFSPPGSRASVEPTLIPLVGEWRFAIDRGDQGEKKEWFISDYDDSTWTVVDVPHTWSVMEENWDYEGVAWYRRSFSLPAQAGEAHLRLRFDAVYYKASVWLNGEYLGEHEGGYTPFEFDVSHIAKTGTDNIVAVRVDNERRDNRIPDDFFDWWPYGGIVRDVSLEITDDAYISRQQIVAVPNIVAWDEAATATVTTTVTVNNASSEIFTGILTADVMQETTGESALETILSSLTSIPPGESVEVEFEVQITEPKLWHFDHPNLYLWTTSLLTNEGKVLHTVKDTFGIRLVELEDARFLLNGEPVRMVGMTRHADSVAYGLAEPVFVMAADYDDMKRLNMVLSRPVHYPQHEYILDYCDRNGILLIPEIPAWQIDVSHMANPDVLATAKQQLKDMILADYNHPSVWAWSVANEIPSDTPQGKTFVQELVALAKELDPTRPVGFASFRLAYQPQRDATDLVDFVMMNGYAGSWHMPKHELSSALDRIHQTWPDKAVIISEFGIDAHWNIYSWSRPGEELDPEEYYFVPDDTPAYSEEVYAMRSQVLRDQMEVFRRKPFVAGAIFWTYQDYRSLMEFRMGILDINHEPTPVWDVIREQYAPVLVDSVVFSEVTDSKQTVVVSLRARGPVEEDMPAYTLREYRIHWAVTSPYGESVFSEGDVFLPTLAPADTWSGEVDWDVPESDYVFTLSIFRPTGFDVIERSYNSRGELLQADGPG